MRVKREDEDGDDVDDVGCRRTAKEANKNNFFITPFKCLSLFQFSAISFTSIQMVQKGQEKSLFMLNVVKTNH